MEHYSPPLKLEAAPTRNIERPWLSTRPLSPVKNGGIRKSSPTKRGSQSPTKRGSQSPTKRKPRSTVKHAPDSFLSSFEDEEYKFDFGRHAGKSIPEVMEVNPSYLDWCPGEKAGDLLASRPYLTAALRDLSLDYLDEHPWLLKDMIRNDLYPYAWSTSRIRKEGVEGDGVFWQATQWDEILDGNTGPIHKPTMNDFKESFEGLNGSSLISFTGTIVRIEEQWAPSGVRPFKRFTILPCGWPRDAVIRASFHPDNAPNDSSEYCDILYKPYKLIGHFQPHGLFVYDFNTLHNPLPSSLCEGIKWKITGWILGWEVLPECKSETVRIRVSLDVHPLDLHQDELNHGGHMIEMLGVASKLKLHGKFWFKGMMFPHWGNFEGMGHHAVLLEEVEQSTA